MCQTMKYFFIFVFLPALVYGGDEKKESAIAGAVGGLFDSGKVVATALAEGVGKGVQAIKPLQNLIMGDCVEPPNQCPNENITFWYYSNCRDNDEKALKLAIDSEEKFQQIPRNGYPWKVIIHGYTKSRKETPNPQLRDAYLKQGNYNFLSVDYYPIAKDKCYLQAVHNVPLVARCTADMIEALASRGFFTLDDLHVIGFSLGGQIAGQLHENLSKPPKRVTLLDPASPLFDGVINTKADKSAGQFVDVIHTNSLLKGEFVDVGHVDFYVNGGVLQPGCLEDKDKGHSTCSHNRAPDYFAESINSKTGFWGIPCEGYAKFQSGACDTTEDKLVLMGQWVNDTARGVYYLQTNRTPPYALGKVTSVRRDPEMN